MTYTTKSPEELIQYLLDQKLCFTTFDREKNEQMIMITDFGKDINEILDYMRMKDKA